MPTPQKHPRYLSAYGHPYPFSRCISITVNIGGSPMAMGAIGDERPELFLRKATGLVRGWSVRDSMIYACLSTNVITLGLVEFAYQGFIPKGQLLTAVLSSGVWVSFLVIAYSGLVVTIPRAGG